MLAKNMIVQEIEMRVEASTARGKVGDIDEWFGEILTNVVRVSVEARLAADTGAKSCERRWSCARRRRNSCYWT